MRCTEIHGVGPRSCEWMVIGSEPNWRDFKEGKPFMGPVGEELNRLLAVAGFSRQQMFLTNLYRQERPDKKAPQPVEHLEYGLECLRSEIERVRPKHIITLGVEVARLFLGDIDIDEVWGLHLLPDASAWERIPELREDVTLLPQTHPAQGFHSPEAASQVLVGFDELKRIVKQKIPARGLYSDAHPNPNYRILGTMMEAASWMVQARTLALDTEGYLHAPWSVQLTKREGEGVILRHESAALHEAALHIKQYHPRVIMHSGLHDIRVAREMGIDLIEAGCEIDDTQLMAYLLGVLPQGLKPLATRECGMRMFSYSEVLGDAQEQHARTWLADLWEKLHARHEALRQEDFEFQKAVCGRRIKKLPEVPKTTLHKAVERVLQSKDPYRLWHDQVLDIQVEGEALAGGEIPEASLSDVEPEKAIRYAGRDPDATLRVYNALKPRIEAMGLEEVYRLDLSTYPIVDRMMQAGILPDVEAFATLGAQIDGELEGLRTILRGETGRLDFNANSGDQVAEFLFDDLGLEPLGKRTTSGRESTNDKVLEALERAHPEIPVIATIRSYREYYKLRYTFIAKIPDLVQRWPYDGRIHCELMLTRTPSGRLAAKGPNLLAMPKHGKFAKAFRRCFVAGENHLLLSSDLSQAELRVLAHLSQDPVMCAIYRKERRNPDGSIIDIHSAMAERIFGVKPADQSGSKHRLPAKAVNFGLPMGMTAIGLTLELRKNGVEVNEDDAQRWIDEADRLYVKVPEYKQRMIAEAQRTGYVRCLSGRIRYVGGIRSKDERVRAEAERFAFSTPIQEGAQWIGKQILASAWQDIFVPYRRQGYWIEPLLWIHDDLLSEMDERITVEVAQRLKAIMNTPPKGFTVPIETAPEAGFDWATMASPLD